MKGVLIGSEEDEAPALGFLFFDHGGDSRELEVRGGVFQTVCQDADNDLVRPQVLTHAVALLQQTEAQGIQQGSTPHGEPGFGVHFGRIRQRDTGIDRVHVLVEENGGDAGFAGFVALGVEELVEAADGVLEGAAHGSAAVENADNFSVHDGLPLW